MSIDPLTETEDLISWFPMYFPVKEPLMVQALFSGNQFLTIEADFLEAGQLEPDTHFQCFALMDTFDLYLFEDGKCHRVNDPNECY